MYRKIITRPIPDDATIVSTSKIRIKVMRKWVEREINASGLMVCESKRFYDRVRQPNGKLKEVPLTSDRASSEQMLAKLRRQAQRIAVGLEEAPLPGKERSLSELAENWFQELENAGRNECHIRTVKARLMSLLETCRLTTLAELSKQETIQKIATSLNNLRRQNSTISLPDSVSFSPAELRTILEISATAFSKLVRTRGISGTGRGKARRFSLAEAKIIISHRGRGSAPNTINGYRASIKAFCNWLHRNGLIDKTPYLPLRGDERKDRRIIRRAITWNDCQGLATAISTNGESKAGMTAEARSLLYRTAFRTLLRARALRELTPGDCHLNGQEPFLSIRSETDKTGRARCIPLPPDLTNDLRRHIVGMPIKKPIWQMPTQMAQLLRDDLKLAGIPFSTEEGVCDFHALRHAGATHMARSCVALDIIAKIGGWNNLQQFFTRYGHYSVTDLAEGARRAW